LSAPKRIPAKWSGDYVRFDARPGDELTITYPLIELPTKSKACGRTRRRNCASASNAGQHGRQHNARAERHALVFPHAARVAVPARMKIPRSNILWLTCVFAALTALQINAEERPELRVGIAGHAFDHLGASVTRRRRLQPAG
jgi:hypothetical protein